MDIKEVTASHSQVEALRVEYYRNRDSIKNEQAKYVEKSALLKSNRSDLNDLVKRRIDLDSGKGKLLCSMRSVRVYEFWLEIPGYSGSIIGASSQIHQYGSLQHVSDVKSQQNSGLTGAIVGGVVLGPIGAGLGALATRKNEITTDSRQVDGRQLELSICGPGYAWSIVLPHARNFEMLRGVRDYINARGSVNESIEDAKSLNNSLISKLKNKEFAISSDIDELKLKISWLNERDAKLKKEYLSILPPISKDLKNRWFFSSRLIKACIILFGPILIFNLSAILMTEIYHGEDFRTNEFLLPIAACVMVWLMLFILYLKKIRLFF